MSTAEPVSDPSPVDPDVKIVDDHVRELLNITYGMDTDLMNVDQSVIQSLQTVRATLGQFPTQSVLNSAGTKSKTATAKSPQSIADALYSLQNNISTLQAKIDNLKAIADSHGQKIDTLPTDIPVQNTQPSTQDSFSSHNSLVIACLVLICLVFVIAVITMVYSIYKLRFVRYV